MDEATAGLKMEIESEPAELDTLSRQVQRLKIEREALKKNRQRFKRTSWKLEKNPTLEEKQKTLSCKMESERTEILKSVAKEKIDMLKGETERRAKEIFSVLQKFAMERFQN